MIVVLPAEIPVTTPLASTVAIEPFDEVQTPFDVALTSCVVEPAHTSAVPVTAATIGVALTVTAVLTVVAQPFAVTV